MRGQQKIQQKTETMFQRQELHEGKIQRNYNGKIVTFIKMSSQYLGWYQRTAYCLQEEQP